MVLLLDIIVEHILIYLFVYTVFSLPYCSIMYNTHWVLNYTRITLFGPENGNHMGIVNVRRKKQN